MLADVARAAGVSVPTVSRVLTGSTPVSDHTRTRVDAAIAELGYRPNEAARALVRGRQSMIGVITSDTTRFGYASTIQGVEEEARAAGLLVAITVMDTALDASVKAAVDLMLGQPVAGVVILDFDIHGARALDMVAQSVPVAAVTSTADAPARHRILFDDHRGGYEATEYLLGLGHRTVHHVAVPGSGRPSGRLLGWRESLEAAGAEVPDVIETDWSVESGYRAGTLLAARGDVTAVLCGNDEVAFGVLRAMHDGGRAVPTEVSVVGFDDHPHSAIWTPSLTTMGQDFVQLGAQAVRALLDDGPTASSSPLHLVVRESTAAPRR